MTETKAERILKNYRAVIGGRAVMKNEQLPAPEEIQEVSDAAARIIKAYKVAVSNSNGTVRRG
ncbi:MAG: hypothetical protein IBX50_18530 [Marinospirillum sp.]|uniref:hypothetical protein n=1 Tax=Marinospirillum sp. TaxID=2183934 RepID=UPI0019F593E8|nr:hypothetical protein [Marinospirillum sp.]MBE0508684.1 hypothetical protein [Marinospirillum sp.]